MITAYGYRAFRPATRGLSLKSAHVLVLACKNIRAYASLFQGGLAQIKDSVADAKAGTLTRDQLMTVGTAWDSLDKNAPSDLDGQTAGDIANIVSKIKQAEKLWPKGMDTLFSFSNTDKGRPKAEQIVVLLKEAGDLAVATAGVLKGLSAAAAGENAEKSKLYQTIMRLKPVVDKLKTDLNPIPGQPIPRIELSVIAEVHDTLQVIIDNPFFPQKYVGIVNNILDVLSPVGGSGIVQKIRGGLYWLTGIGEREIRNALNTVVSKYSNIVDSISKRG